MIMEWIDNDRSRIRPLFEAHRRARGLIFPALDQGRGVVWTDSLETPTVACLHLVVLNALAGDSSSPNAKELIQMIEPNQVVISPDEKWTKLIKNLWGERVGVIKRALLSHKSLDLEHLKSLREHLPSGYTLERMDLETIRRLDKRSSMHILTFFGSSKEFYERGIAYCIKHDGKVVSMASTFTPFTDVFDIEIDTFDETHRRKGLATVVSAALIIHALENGLVPYWDAENEVSINLALKLGYTDPDYWEAYYLKPPR
ncbi:MAG: GNAT family N-acetyltransferase [Candidatus Thorarchaeota archaeon]